MVSRRTKASSARAREPSSTRHLTRSSLAGRKAGSRGSTSAKAGSRLRRASHCWRASRFHPSITSSSIGVSAWPGGRLSSPPLLPATWMRRSSAMRASRFSGLVRMARRKWAIAAGPSPEARARSPRPTLCSAGSPAAATMRFARSRSPVASNLRTIWMRSQSSSGTASESKGANESDGLKRSPARTIAGEFICRRFRSSVLTGAPAAKARAPASSRTMWARMSSAVWMPSSAES